MGTARMAAENTRLPEYPPEATDSMESVRCLVDRYANVAASTRRALDEADKAGDADTVDLFTEWHAEEAPRACPIAEQACAEKVRHCGEYLQAAELREVRELGALKRGRERLGRVLVNAGHRSLLDTLPRR